VKTPSTNKDSGSFTQHDKVTDVNWLRQEFIETIHQWLEIRHAQVSLQGRLINKILVEYEPVWIIGVMVEIIVDATGLSARGSHKAVQNIEQFSPLFGLCNNSSNDCAARLLHVMFSWFG
jgi:hypothetical protein